MQFIKKHKVSMIIMCILISFLFLGCIIHGADYDITDVPKEVYKVMEKSSLSFGDMFIGILRSIGYFIYKFLGMLLDLANDGFTTLANWDIFELKPVKNVSVNMKQILYVLIPLAIAVIAILNVLKLKSPLEFFYNIVMTAICMSIFLTVMGWGFELKTALLGEIDVIVGKDASDTLSESMYKKNTIDIQKSIEEKKVFRLSDYKTFGLDGFDQSQTISSDILNTKYVNKGNGLESKKLSNGIAGFGDERWYAYFTDYYALNFTLLVTFIINLLAMFKLGFLIAEWLKIKTTGVLFMIRGYADLKYVGKIYASGGNNLLAMCILYFGMMFYTVISQALIQNTTFDNWLLTVIVLFALGMGLIIGDSYFNDALGVDDGSKFMMKSLFAGQRFWRMGKGIARGAGSLVSGGANMIGTGAEKLADGVSTLGDKANDMIQASADRRNSEFNEMFADNMKEFSDNYNPDDVTKLLGDSNTSDGRLHPVENAKFVGDENGNISVKSNRPEQFYARQREQQEANKLNQKPDHMEEFKKDLEKEQEHPSNEHTENASNHSKNDKGMSGIKDAIIGNNNTVNGYTGGNVIGDNNVINGELYEHGEDYEPDHDSELFNESFDETLNNVFNQAEKSGSYKMEFEGKSATIPMDVANEINDVYTFGDVLEKYNRDNSYTRRDVAEMYGQFSNAKTQYAEMRNSVDEFADILKDLEDLPDIDLSAEAQKFSAERQEEHRKKYKSYGNRRKK